MSFPPRLGAPVLVVTARPDLVEARIVPGTIHGYTVRASGHGVEEMVLVEARDGQILDVPASFVIDFDPKYGAFELERTVTRLLTPAPELVEATH